MILTFHDIFIGLLLLVFTGCVSKHDLLKMQNTKVIKPVMVMKTPCKVLRVSEVKVFNEWLVELLNLS